MTDERDRHHEDEDLTPVTPSTLEEAEAEAAQGSTDFVETERAEEQLDEADAAEIDEAEAAAAEEWQEDLDQDEDAQFQIEEAMAAAHQASLEARATWSLVHRELFVFLFANILFFVGVLAAWSRMSAGLVSSAEDPTTWVANQINGLDTIRGTIIFALSLYGFWTIVFNIWYRQLKIWPFLINALLALWVGIPAFTSGIGSARWDAAKAAPRRHADEDAPRQDHRSHVEHRTRLLAADHRWRARPDRPPEGHPRRHVELEGSAGRGRGGPSPSPLSVSNRPSG